MTYQLRRGANAKIKTIKSKFINLSVALMFALTSLVGAAPLIFAGTAHAAGAETVYNALPSVDPSTNYPSQPFQAQQTDEFGDYVHLGGSNRVLNSVTVTMSDWAKFSDYASNSTWNSNESHWTYPVTLNVYSSHLGTNGAPDQKLATVTQDVNIPWRPASDPSCGDTSNGKGWKVGDTCFNYSGIAFNATFDLSSLKVTLPDDVIVGVALNTQTWGYHPTGVAGPYNSLNVAIPANNTASVGTDDSSDEVFWNTHTCSYYTAPGTCNVFRKDTNWSPYGTVALAISATPADTTAPAAPTITAPAARSWHNTAPITDAWTAVTQDINGGSETIDHYQIAYNYDDGHPFGGTNTCPGVVIPGTTGFVGCRDVAGTSRQHQPGTNEEGGVTIWVRAIDTAGNVGAWSKSVHYYYDHSNPSTTIVAPTGLVGKNFTVSGDAQDNLSLNRVYVQLVNRSNSQRYGGTTVNLIGQGTSAHWSVNYNAATLHLPDGQYAAHVAVVDMADNTGSAGWTDNFTVDSTAPVVSITAPSDGDTVRGNVNVSGNVTDLNPDHYYFVVKDVHGVVKAGPGVVNQATVSSWSWDTTKVADGVYAIDLEARDAAGNKDSGSTKVIHVTVDNTAPSATINAYIGTDTTPTLTGTVDDPSADLTVAIDGGSAMSVTNNSDGTWSFNVPSALSIGSHTITLTATDAAGNTYQTTANVTVKAASASPTAMTASNGRGNSNQAPGHLSTVTVTPNNDGQVLGANTTQSQTPSNENGQVKGDSTSLTNSSSKKDVRNSSSFMNLGWWWLLIVGVALGFFWLVFGRRRNPQN